MKELAFSKPLINTLCGMRTLAVGGPATAIAIKSPAFSGIEKIGGGRPQFLTGQNLSEGSLLIVYYYSLTIYYLLLVSLGVL